MKRLHVMLSNGQVLAEDQIATTRRFAKNDIVTTGLATGRVVRRREDVYTIELTSGDRIFVRESELQEVSDDATEDTPLPTPLPEASDQSRPQSSAPEEETSSG